MCVVLHPDVDVYVLSFIIVRISPETLISIRLIGTSP